MKTKKEKRINAIAGYEAAIARHNANLESIPSFVDPESTQGQLIILGEKDKIKKLNDLVYHTSQALGYGGR